MQMEAEVERLAKLKTSRLKDIFMKRRRELEEICQNAHIEPDVSTAPEQTDALIDSGCSLCILLCYYIHMCSCFFYIYDILVLITSRPHGPLCTPGKY